MAGNTSLKALICFFTLVLALIGSEGRPLTPRRSYATKGIAILSDEQFMVEAIKTGGPSSGGEGHSFPNDVAQTLGGIKNSGPSPGGRGH